MGGPCAPVTQSCAEEDYYDILLELPQVGSGNHGCSGGVRPAAADILSGRLLSRSQTEVRTGIIRNAMASVLPQFEVIVLRGEWPLTDEDSGDSSFFDGDKVNKSP